MGGWWRGTPLPGAPPKIQRSPPPPVPLGLVALDTVKCLLEAFGIFFICTWTPPHPRSLWTSRTAPTPQTSPDPQNSPLTPRAPSTSNTPSAPQFLFLVSSPL